MEQIAIERQLGTWHFHPALAYSAAHDAVGCRRVPGH
jgi:hypothetical protein